MAAQSAMKQFWQQMGMSCGAVAQSTDTKVQDQSLGQSMWGVTRKDYGIPKGLEKRLVKKRTLIMWASLVAMLFAIAPGFFPQVRELIALADIGVKESLIRVFIFFGACFVMTWLVDRGFREED